MRRHPADLLFGLLTLLAVALPLGCGGEERDARRAPTGTGAAASPDRAVPRVDLALDFTPNAVHAPVYAAVRTGADRRAGIRLRIRPPGQGPDGLRLVASGRALVGILDIHDLAIARERGADVVGVGALVQRPLAALLADPSVRRPRDLAGRTVGVSGLPSDPAFLRAIVEQDGGDYEAIRQVTIGFKAVSALLARRVAAVPAFWNAEGVALERRGRRVRQFRVEDYGAPAYPEVVFITSRRSLERRREDVRAAMRAVAAGVGEVLARPDAAVAEIAQASDSTDTDLVRAQLEAVAPLFEPAIRLDRAVLERWAEFDARIGIVRRRPDVGRAFDLSIAS